MTAFVPGRLSIVTISFNQAEFLERAIKSVIEQQGVDLEYIVVDPGSTDGSREIIGRYADQIQILLLEPDDGPADGLNRGLAAASGEFFAYLNADDEFLPGALREASAHLAANPDLDVVYGNGYHIDEAGRRTKHLISSRFVGPQLYARGLVTIIQQASFMRTKALRAVGGFNAENRTCWDAEAFLDIARHGGRFRRVWRDWGLFRLHGGSISGSGRLFERYVRDLHRMFRRINGRDPGALDRLVVRAARLALNFYDLKGTAAKVADRLGRSRETR